MVGRTAVHDVPTASLADAVGSWQPLFEHRKQGKLTRRLLSKYTGSQDVECFLSNARAVCPAHSVRSSLSLRCSSWSFLDTSLKSLLWVTGRTSPGYAYPVGTLPQARHLVPGCTATGYGEAYGATFSCDVLITYSFLDYHIADDSKYGSTPGLIEAEGICP